MIDHLDQLYNDANAALVSDTPFVMETLLDAEKAVAYVKRILGDGGGNADNGTDGTSGAGLDWFGDLALDLTFGSHELT